MGYTYPDNFRAQKALIAAKYSGAEVTVAKDFVFGETNKSPEFLKKFPLGKVPAFEGSDGLLLTESNAIAYYVAKEDIKAALKTLNDHLLTRTFQVGERVTLADIAVACTMISLYKQVLDPAFRKPFGNVT